MERSLCVLRCFVSKVLAVKRISALLLAFSLAAAFALTFAGVVLRNFAAGGSRRTSAVIYFPETLSADTVFPIFQSAYEKGDIRGFFLLADYYPERRAFLYGAYGSDGRYGSVGTAGVSENRFDTEENFFWVNKGLVPSEFLFDRIPELTARVGGTDLRCAGITFGDLFYSHYLQQRLERLRSGRVEFLVNSLPPTRNEDIYPDYGYSAAVSDLSGLCVSAAWMAREKTPVVMASVEVSRAEDEGTLERIVRELPAGSEYMHRWYRYAVGGTKIEDTAFLHMSALCFGLFGLSALMCGLLDRLRDDMARLRRVGMPAHCAAFGVCAVIFAFTLPAYCVALAIMNALSNWEAFANVAVRLRPRDAVLLGSMFVGLQLIVGLLHFLSIQRSISKRA